MKRFTLSLIFLLVGAVGLSAQNIVITLKDGGEIIGTELKAEETAAALAVRLRNDKGIMETVSVAKDEIASSRPFGPNDKLFAVLKNHTPAPDLLPKSEYQGRIDGCKQFLTLHEKTATAKQLAAVKKILDELETEFALIKVGGLKFDNRVIRKEDLQNNRYEFDMRIALAKMQDAFNAGDYRGAMIRFEKIHRDYINSERYEEARKLALETLAAYKRQIADMLKVVDAEVTARETSLLGIPAQERAEEQAAVERADALYQARLKKDRKLNPKWLLLNRFHKQPMEEVARNITSATASLSQPRPENAPTVGPVYRETWAAIGSGDLEAAEKLFGQLKTLRVPKVYLAEIEAKVNPPEPTPDPSTPTPGTPATETPVGEEDPAEGEPKEGDPKKVPPKKTTPSAPSGDEAAPPAYAEDAAEPKGFPTQLVLVVVLVLVIVGALLAAFTGKKK